MKSVNQHHWSFKPSEAFDAIVFMNAVSTHDFYARNYPSLRAEWEPRLGERGLECIDDRPYSASALCFLLHYVGVTTLDDVLRSLQDFESTRAAIEQAMDQDPSLAEWLKPERLQLLETIDTKRDTVLQGFSLLKKAGFVEHWASHVLPKLREAADSARFRMATLPLQPIAERISEFLGCEKTPSGNNVYLTNYVKPIAFTLPGGGMVTHPDYLPDPRKVAQLCVHETLHGFPGATEALAQQEKLRIDPLFESQYQELVNRWKSGPEEYLVTGAEAYLAEELGLSTYEECMKHLDTQNGGMLLSKRLYLRLRECKPDLLPEWQGFGTWVTLELAEGRIWPIADQGKGR